MNVNRAVYEYYNGAAWTQIEATATGSVLLDNTSSASDVETALAGANVYIVYLKPGAYTWGNSNLAIPANKAVIGLGGIGDGTQVEITLQVDATHRVQMANGTTLRDLNLLFDSASTAGNEMVETGTNEGVTVEGVTVDGSAVAAGVGIASHAILGRIKKLSHCEFNKCYGANIDSNSVSDEGGVIEVSYIHHDGVTGNTNILNVAVTVSASSVHTSHIHAENGYGAIYSTGQLCKHSHVIAENVLETGLRSTGAKCTIDDVTIEVCTKTGVYVGGNDITISNIMCRACTDYGFVADGDAQQLRRSQFSNITCDACGDGSKPAIWFEEVVNCRIAGLHSEDSVWRGIVLEDIADCIVSDIQAHNSGNIGILIFNQSLNNYRNVFNGIYSYFSGGNGIQVQDSGVGEDLAMGTVVSINNTGHGISWNHGRGTLTGATLMDNSSDGLNVSAGVVSGTFTGILAESNGSDGVSVGGGCDKLFFSSIQTVGNTANGFLGGDPGAGKVCSLMGHTSDGDGTNRTLTAVGGTWNSANTW